MKNIFFIIIICTYILLTGCNGTSSPVKPEHVHVHDHETHDHENEEGAGRALEHESEEYAHSEEIILKQGEAESIGLTTKKMVPEDFSEVIKCSGQILAAQGDESTLVAPVSGVVSFGKKVLADGTAVQKGSVLFVISGKGLAEGDPVEKARINYETARKDYQRAEELVKDKIISEKEFNRIYQEYETARMAYQAIGRNMQSGAAVSATMNGFVKSCLVKEGDYVEVGQPLAVLSQNRKLQLRAEVSERYYKSLPSLISANFKTPYDSKVYDLKELNGRLLTYGKSSSGSFYIPVTFEFDNKGEVIPGSYVEVYLIASPLKNVLKVPVSSLSEEQGLYFVYLRLDKEGYRKQEVTLGASDGKNVQILSGLKPGDEVVTKGVYQVKLAANSGVIPEGHTHNH